MAKKTDRDLLEETLQRVVRTETRLVTLGLKLGHTLNEDEEITVVEESRAVYLATLDVPYTHVIRAARKAGLNGKKVSVWHNGYCLGDLQA